MLIALYAKVQTVEQFLGPRIPDEYHARLIVEQDVADYVTLVREGLVCTERGITDSEITFSCSQLSTQNDVLLRVIQKLKTKRSHFKNLLLFGFCQMTDNPVSQVSSCSNIEYNYPNYHVSRLQLPAWTLLLQRIGDDLMSHLLETRVIFIPVDNNCWIQVTGRPVYDMWQYPTIIKIQSHGRNETRYDHQDRLGRNSGRNNRRKPQKLTRKQKLPKLQPIHEVLLKQSTNHKALFLEHHHGDTLEDQSSGSQCRKRKREDEEDPLFVKRSCLVHESSQSIGNNTEKCLQTSCQHLQTSCQNLQTSRHHLQTEEPKAHIIHHTLPTANQSTCHNPVIPRVKVTRGTHSEEQDKQCHSSGDRRESENVTYHVIRHSTGHVTDRVTRHSTGHVINHSFDHVTRHVLLKRDNLPYWRDPELTFDPEVSSLHCIDFSKMSVPDTAYSDTPCLGNNQHVTIGTTMEGKYNNTTHTEYEVKPPGMCSEQGSFQELNSCNADQCDNNTSLTGMSRNQSVCNSPEVGLYQARGELAAGDKFPGSRTYGSNEVTSLAVTATNMEARKMYTIPAATNSCDMRKIKTFSTNAMFDRSVIFYARNMREKFPTGSILQLLCRGPETVMADVFSVTLSQMVWCSCKPPDKSSSSVTAPSNQQYIPASNQRQVLDAISKLIHNINSSEKVIHLLLDQCATAETPGECGENHSELKYSPGSSTLLSAPCFTRGSYKSPSTSDRSSHGLNPSSSPSCIAVMSGDSVNRLSESVLRDLDKEWSSPTGGDKKQLGTLLEEYMTICQVKRFLRIVITKLLPRSLLGMKNTKIFIKAVERFVELGRYERFYVGSLTKGMKTSSVPWLHGMCHTDKALCIQQLLAWLHTHLVISILKSYFYITESSVHRNHVFYYRKRTWSLIRQLAMKEYLSKGHLKPISKEYARGVISSSESLGVAQLRFLPKTSGVRPIVNLGALHVFTKKSGHSVNRQLQFLHGVLTHEKSDASLGSSQFGLDDIYQTWRGFVVNRRNTGDTRPLYFIKVDIECCYDSINQVKLYDIIKEKLGQSEAVDYVMRRYCTVLASGGQLKRVFRRSVCHLVDYIPDFTHFANQEIHKNNNKDVIFVDQVLHGHQAHCELLKTLKAHLFTNVVMVGEHYYLQTHGIVQGSMISTLLCNYYYGAMEKQHIQLLSDELLMRQVDDFLFVTPHRENAQRFLDTMVTGFPDYNCKVNPKKTLTNLPQERGSITCLPPGALFPWCGLLFDVKSLEIRVDYTRYCGLAMRDVMTLEVHREPGANMIKKLFSSLRLKCHGMFLDHQVNSLPVLVDNVFSMFLLTSIKFHYNVRELPHKQGARGNIKLFTDTIQSLPAYFKHCMKSKTLQCNKQNPLTLPVIQWLCYKAFVLKLRLHQSEYSGVISWLNGQIRSLNKVVRVPSHAVPSELPPEFQHLLV